MKFVFDIDGVICTLEPVGKYDEATPFYDVIGFINKLQDDGNIVILYTARGMKDGDVDKAYNEWHDVTKKQMDNWGVKHTDLIMGKPAGDYYIDDKAINIQNGNIEHLTNIIKRGIDD